MQRMPFCFYVLFLSLLLARTVGAQAALDGRWNFPLRDERRRQSARVAAHGCTALWRSKRRNGARQTTLLRGMTWNSGAARRHLDLVGLVCKIAQLVLHTACGPASCWALPFDAARLSYLLHLAVLCKPAIFLAGLSTKPRFLSLPPIAKLAVRS